jgi:hypothetical protein
MRFVILRKADAMTEAGEFPPNTAELFEKMGNYMEEMHKAGVLLGGEGLQPSSKGARIRFVNGKATVIDGPFAEAKELVAGYTTIKAGSLAEALEWTKRWPPEDGDVELEVRQIHDADDLGEAFTPELREAEDRLRERAAKNA